MTQVVAVDWSGRAKGAAEAIWLARVVDGRLCELENGMERAEVIARVVELKDEDRQTFVGLDFAFGFPAWFARERGWRTGREVWDAMRDGSESILRDCPAPFWGRRDKRLPAGSEMFRASEGPLGAKSVFQIGGAGAVGTGSLRGMPHLATLADAGFSIWPFDDPQPPLVVEIYPRLLTSPPVVKSRHRQRRDHLDAHFADQCERLRERAAGSEDAFDAAVSALVMAEHLAQLENLPTLHPDHVARVEGAIWQPS